MAAGTWLARMRKARRLREAAKKAGERKIYMIDTDEREGQRRKRCERKGKGGCKEKEKGREQQAGKESGK